MVASIVTRSPKVSWSEVVSQVGDTHRKHWRLDLCVSFLPLAL